MILLPLLAVLTTTPAQVAFKVLPGGTSAIVRLDQDGSNLVQLTGGKVVPSEFGAFSWAPDGTRLVYASNDGDLWVVNADGTGATRITTDGNNDNAAWSPKGDTIAYVHTVRIRNRSGTFDLHEDIWLVGPDGKSQRRLTTDAGEKGPPSWSPDGTKLLYWRFGTTPIYTTKLYVVDVGTGAVILTTADHAGAWSPDGGRIAVVSSGGIDVINADGSGRLTVAPGGGRPQWSPDGAKIAFDRTHCVLGIKGMCSTVLSAVYVVPSTGGSETRLTGPIGGGAGSLLDGFPNGYGQSPTWWPDGSRLFYEWNSNTIVMNPDGTCETSFGHTRLLLDTPAWRPGVLPSLPPTGCAQLHVRAVSTRGRLAVTVENDGNEPATGVKLSIRVTHGKATIQQPVRSLGPIASERATHVVVAYSTKQTVDLRVSVTGSGPDSRTVTSSVELSAR